MANWREQIDRAREEARRAREEAERLRRDARELEHRLRQEARNARRGFAQAFNDDAGRDDGGGREGDSGVSSQEAFSLEGIRDVSIDQTAGNLTVRLCAEGETPGAISSARTAPRLEVRREGDRLIIEVHTAKGWLFRRKSGPTTVVRLQPELRSIRANLGYGELQLRDLTAETLKFDLGAGQITAFAMSGALDADIGAGKMSINAHEGTAKCNMGTGDILLDIAKVTPGEIKVEVGMGRAEIRLPAGEQVHVSTSSGIGRAKNDYPSAAEDAPARLKASSGIGEVIVKARSVPAAGDQPSGMAKPQRASRDEPSRRRHEAEELRILQMLEQGRISSQDAADLIAALQGAAPRFEPEAEEPGETEA